MSEDDDALADDHRLVARTWVLIADPHDFVSRSKGEYVADAVHTQTIDSFWSLLKRGIMGSFHKVSRKYLPLYVAEFEFRYNNRSNADIFGAAIAAC